MAKNGSSKTLTTEQVRKLKKTVYTQDNMGLFLASHGLVLAQVQYPLTKGRCSEVLYKKLSKANLI